MSEPEEIQPNGYYTELKDRLLVVKRGWNSKIADALVESSREQAITARFPCDRYKRFPDIDTAGRWAEKDPTMVVYTLALGRTARLAGVIWMAHPEETMGDVQAEHAFYMRMYESSRGRGERELAIGFGRSALADYETLEHDGNLGLKIDREDPDKRIYEDLGFNSVGNRPRPMDKYVQMVRPGFVGRLSSGTRRHS